MTGIFTKILLTVTSLTLITNIPSSTIAQNTETQGVNISFRNETSTTKISGIYTRGNYRNAQWGSNRIRVFSYLDPGETINFSLPTGIYDFCAQTSIKIGGKYSYRSILWNDQFIMSNNNFVITRESWEVKYWSNLPCSMR